MASMLTRRLVVPLDDETLTLLRSQAQRQGCSMAAYVRGFVRDAANPKPVAPVVAVKDLLAVLEAAKRDEALLGVIR